MSQHDGNEADDTAPPALELDCRAMACPRPIIELAHHLERVSVGELIVVIADDPAAAVDVAAWCRMRGQEYVGTATAADGTPSYQVRRLS